VLNVKIGTAPVNWNNEDVPDYRPWTEYGQMLDEMAEAGYDATEVSSQFPADPDQTKRDLQSRGLEPASSFVALNLRDKELLDRETNRAVERARYVRSLGTDVLIVADSGDERRQALAGHVGSADGLDDASWQRLVNGLERVADRCAREGVRIVFHNHVGSYIETEAELSRLLDMSDPARVGLCLDVGHLLFGGGDVMRVMGAYGARVQYVHLKDVDLEVLDRCRREELGFRDALRLGIFTEFGAGGMDFDSFFAALENQGYSGWMIVEQDTTRKTPMESAKISREYLRRRRVGLPPQPRFIS
jgi:inosose dehydratase